MYCEKIEGQKLNRLFWNKQGNFSTEGPQNGHESFQFKTVTSH